MARTASARRGGRMLVAICVLSLGAMIVLVGCGDDSSDQAGTAPTDGPVATTSGTRPTCSTFYRSSVTVSPDDGPILAFATPGTSEATFTDLHLTATYLDDGAESPALSVRVETLPDRAPVFASLYQFVDPTVDLNAFGSSGQGFTGLIYVYNPVSGSELQFFCSAP